MNIQDLLSYAETFQRPAYQLRAASHENDIVAHWGGNRSDLADDPRFIHVLSFDLSVVKKLGLPKRLLESFINYPQILAIFNGPSGRQIRDKPVEASSLSEVTFQKTVPLKAMETIALPPLEALLLLGDSRIDTWMAGYDLERWEYQEFVNDVTREYRQIVDAQSSYRDDSVSRSLSQNRANSCTHKSHKRTE